MAGSTLLYPIKNDTHPECDIATISVYINDQQNIATLSFPYDPNIVEIIKTINGRRWIPGEKVWTIPLRSDVRPFLTALFKNRACCEFINDNTRPASAIGSSTSAPLHRENAGIPPHTKITAKAPQTFIDYLIKKRYSKCTIRNYTHHLTRFLQYVNKPGELISAVDVSNYLVFCATDEKYSSAYHKMAIHAIKFYIA
jgi:hypothetical protein